MRTGKAIIYIALIVGLVSALQYSYDSLVESFKLAGKSYAQKQDYVESVYNGYMVYRYHIWLKDDLGIREYGLLVADTDKKSYGRYEHRLNYFLYPRRIREDAGVLFAPRLDTIKGKTFRLFRVKDNMGIFVSK